MAVKRLSFDIFMIYSKVTLNWNSEFQGRGTHSLLSLIALGDWIPLGIKLEISAFIGKTSGA